MNFVKYMFVLATNIINTVMAGIELQWNRPIYEIRKAKYLTSMISHSDAQINNKMSEYNRLFFI